MSQDGIIKTFKPNDQVLPKQSNNALWSFKLGNNLITGKPGKAVDHLFTAKVGESQQLVLIRPNGSSFTGEFIVPKDNAAKQV